jgi:hypothetical protein
MIFAFLATMTIASENYTDAMLGTMFPVFDIEEHCRLMALSSSPKIVHMSKSCVKSENEYKEMAQGAWTLAVDSDRSMCELDALQAVGSYQVLASCLNAQTSTRILLKMPLRDKP